VVSLRHVTFAGHVEGSVLKETFAAAEVGTEKQPVTKTARAKPKNRMAP
jgi:hypothetical protein